MYMKYMRAKTVRAISNDSMVWLFSIAVKCPCWSMSEKTRICRNMAPPKQLNPKLWMSTRILRSSFVVLFICYRE